MIRMITFNSFVLLALSFCVFATAHAAERTCGERIQAGDVLVVDLEPFVDQEDQFYAELNEKAGDAVLVTQEPVRVRSRGSVARTTKSARESAATLGCDLVVLLGYQVVETRWEAKVTPERWLMVHMGKRENP